MFRASILCSSILILSACTQPAVTVDNRGTDSFSRSGATGGSSMFAYHSPSSTYASSTPYKHSTPSFSYSPVTNNSAPVSGIGVTDLSPAAGQQASSIPPAQNMGTATAAQPMHNGTTVQAFGTTKPSVPLENNTAEAATGTAEAAPVNAWTNKPREEAAPVKLSSAAAAKTSYIWPVSSHDVISSFGSKGGGKANDGMNISAAQGEPVWAAADGEIVYADGKMKGYGNMVLVKHAGGKTSTYAHLARISVEKYDRVKQGDIIGYVGSTGNVSKPQLYFSMRDGSAAVDPQKYLGRDVAGL